MRAIFVAALLFLAGCVQTSEPTQSAEPVQHVFPGEYMRTDMGWSLPLAEGPFAALPVEHHRLTSAFDGISFPVGVYLPDVPAGTQVPAIVEVTPYLPLPADFDSHYQQDALEPFIAHGYAVVLVGMRGTTDAGGCMDLMGPGEQADANQALDWVADQTWFSGNASVMGLSYPGSTPWFLAATGHPAVKTIVPMAGLTDTYELLLHNGTTEFGWWVPLLYWTGSAAPGGGYGNGDVQRLACPAAVEGMTTLGYALAAKERDPTGYWSARESRSGTLANYEGSVFLIHGLQDWNVDPHMAYPFVNALEAQGIVVKHLLGQWGHTFPDQADEESTRADFGEILLRWFDRELKGLDVDVGPMAQVQDNHMQWRSEETWPPLDVELQFLYLGNDRTLSHNETSTGTEMLTPTYSGEFFCYVACGPTYDTCEDCPSFVGDALSQDLRIAGLPRVHLRVTPTGPGGEIAAILYDVAPSGERERIGWGQIELHNAAGDGTRNEVVPGQPLLAKLQLQPLDAVVAAGNHLELEIFQGTYGDHFAGTPNYPVQLETGGSQSVLVVDTFERDASAFFDAPTWRILGSEM